MAMSTFFRLNLVGAVVSAVLAFSAVHWNTEASAQGLVDLVLRNVEVQTAKADGSAWDAFGGRPDLRVHIRSGRKQHLSALKSDVYRVDFKAKTIRVSPGDVIQIIVRDQDVAIDDEIGRFRVKLTAAQVRMGRVTFGGFGRVKAISVEFRR